ncbi:P2X purinoceptor 7-like [Exaiptasia diaphana]|uniref:P2X purinoreceptor 7 intracellular domain-containing protein n=1 Tax=Exaiptasia diaphana TaxID=2652724 RepID=A0A913Y797_EXADI|nr:P2X purinoceptor 7-like [Exaiptasia diaphana]
MAEPFQFEPEFDENEIRSDESNKGSNSSEEETIRDQDTRLEDASTWCSCGQCEVLETAEMCICCKNLRFINHLTQDIECVTYHEDFEPVCLNRGSLWTALVSLHDRESASLPKPDKVPNESLRYAAYRQFTWWKHGYLGKNIRRVIPACAVSKIRSKYPDPNGQYRGFVNNDNESDVVWEF